MPRNGTGTYSLPAGNPVVSGTTISSTTQNNTMNDVATALTQSMSADGQTPVTNNLPMNNHKLTGLASGATSGDALVYGQSGATVGDLTVSGSIVGGSLTASGEIASTTGPVVSGGQVNATTSISAGTSLAVGTTIMAGQAITTSTTFVGGDITLSSQTAFRAYRSIGTQTSGTVAQFPTAELNQNSAFDTSTGIFTAPANGTYVFTSALYINTSSGTPDGITMEISGGHNITYPIETAGKYLITLNTVVHLTASATVKLRRLGSSAFAAGFYIDANYSGGECYFSGYKFG